MGFILSIILFSAIYALTHLYFAFFIHISKWASIPIVILIAFIMNAYWINFILKRVYAKSFPEIIVNISYFSAALGFYIVIYYFIVDILRIIPAFRYNRLYEGVFVIMISLITVLYGYVNATKTKIVEQHYVTKKKNADIKIAFLSDIHIGSLGINKQKILKDFETINAANPDIVIIGGDILDGEMNPFIRDDYGEAFMKLKAKYGVFAIIGNHEYYGDFTVPQVISVFEKYGIKVLRDENYNLKDKNIVIIGQDMVDRHIGCNETKKYNETAKKWFRIASVKSTKELVSEVDNFDEKYSILVSHTPKCVKENAKFGIDLQLSGHTHNGQMFPLNYVVKMIYDNPYGYKKFQNMDSFVSSGLGLWGTPARISSTPEIVIIDINSEK